MVQVPTSAKVNTPLLVIVHTPVVLEVKLTLRPESELADSVGEVPKLWVPGSLNVMVWLAVGVTLFEAAEAAPVPAELVAVTVKV